MLPIHGSISALQVELSLLCRLLTNEEHTDTSDHPLLILGNQAAVS